MKAEELHRDAFIFDGLSAAKLDEEYVTETLPTAGFNAIQKTIADEPMDNTMEFETAVKRVKDLQLEIDEWDGVRQARSSSDIREFDGLSIVFGFQDGVPIGRDPENLRVFDQLGIGTFQLTYNTMNHYGVGCVEDTEGGLSALGAEVIDALEKYGTLLDLSHAAPKTAWDALGVTDQPTIVSHSNAAALQPHYRNVSDDLAKAIVETGGIVGLTPFGAFVSDDPTMDDFIDHIEHMSDLVGAENVGIGYDFVDNKPIEDYVDAFSLDPKMDPRNWHYPPNLGTASDLPNLTPQLVDRGFTESEIRGFLGENLLRVYEDVWN